MYRALLLTAIDVPVRFARTHPLLHAPTRRYTLDASHTARHLYTYRDGTVLFALHQARKLAAKGVGGEALGVDRLLDAKLCGGAPKAGVRAA